MRRVSVSLLHVSQAPAQMPLPQRENPWSPSRHDTLDHPTLGFPGGSAANNLLAMKESQETQVPPLGQEDALERGMATHSSILARRIPSAEEPGGLQSLGWQRVGHD